MLKQLVEQLTVAPMLGVDLGSSAIKVVELGTSAGRLVLRRCAVGAVDGGDAAGALRQLLTDAGITATEAAISLASPELIVRPLQLPPMPKKELAAAIRLEVEQAILNGHAPEEMAIDWYLFGSRTEGLRRGLLAVVPKTVLAERMAVAQRIGLRPVAVDVDGLALWNAYWRLVGQPHMSGKTVLLINVGVSTTNLVIAKGPDELLLIRDVRLGSHAITHDHAADWLEELRDSLSYARSNAGLRSIEAVAVTGGGAEAAIPLVSSVVSGPVRVWNPLDQLPNESESPVVKPSVGPLLAVAIGLALRHAS